MFAWALGAPLAACAERDAHLSLRALREPDSPHAADAGHAADAALGPSDVEAPRNGAADDASYVWLGDPPEVQEPARPCNGATALCARRYDDVTHPVTHGAMTGLGLWLHPAQRRSLRQQLDDGIRGLMLEVHERAGEATLCLADCAEGHEALSLRLADVRAFLDVNPREVVTLLVDNRVDAATIEEALESAGLSSQLYAGSVAEGWPSLGELVDADTRLVVFLRDARGAIAGLRSWTGSLRSTRSDARQLSELDCELVAGEAGAPLRFVHNALYQPEPSVDAGPDAVAPLLRASPELAELANAEPGLAQRLEVCATAWGRRPSFVGVHFYDVGNVIGAAQRLNGLTPD